MARRGVYLKYSKYLKRFRFILSAVQDTICWRKTSIKHMEVFGVRLDFICDVKEKYPIFLLYVKVSLKGSKGATAQVFHNHWACSKHVNYMGFIKWHADIPLPQKRVGGEKWVPPEVDWVTPVLKFCCSLVLDGIDFQ